MSGIYCEYVVFVTVIPPDNLLVTLPIYVRNKVDAEGLVVTLRELGYVRDVNGSQARIKTVEWCKL